MSKRELIIVMVVVTGVLMMGCDSETTVAEAPRHQGPYLGQDPPGLEPRLYAPGLISTSLHDDGPPKFSPDGTEVYFRKWAVPHDIIGHMRQISGTWTAPAQFAVFGRYLVGAPCFKPDGSGAYFLSRRPRSGEGEPDDYNIWYADRTAAGWGDLTYLDEPVNTMDNDYIWSVASDGTMYLQGNYEGGQGGYDIWISEMVDGVHQAAVNAGPPLNTEHVESAPFVAPDESFIVFCSYGRDDVLGSIDLYVSFRDAEGGWGPGINLGPTVNSEQSDKFPALSPDGKYLFFVSGRGADRSYVQSGQTYDELMAINKGPGNGMGDDVYWVSAQVIENVRPD